MLVEDPPPHKDAHSGAAHSQVITTVDAIFHTINAATGVDARLREFRIDAVTAGQDALGETSVVLEADGVVGSGQGVSTDILEANGRAYVRALSNALRHQRVQTEAEAATAPTP